MRSLSIEHALLAAGSFHHNESLTLCHVPNPPATITAVINPHAKTESGFVQCFADMEVAELYLKALRKKR